MDFDFSLLIWIHVTSALAALAAGAATLMLPKGTRHHRLLGIFYIASMIITVVSAATAPATVLTFGNTRFGFFHVFVLIGAVSLAFALHALLRWRTSRSLEALRAHQTHFAYSYAGLLMAAVSQLAVNPRFTPASIATPAAYWTIFIGINLAIYASAAWVIETRLRRGDPMRFAPRRP